MRPETFVKALDTIEELLPVLKSLTAMGLSDLEIKRAVGYKGKHVEEWASKLNKDSPEYQTALAQAKEAFNTRLLAGALKLANGYEYTEEVTTYKSIQDPMDATQIIEIPIKRAEYKKKQPGNSALLQFLLEKHLPDKYQSNQTADKRTLNLNITGSTSADQIQKLVGKILDVKPIEAEFEPEEDEDESERP